MPPHRRRWFWLLLALAGGVVTVHLLVECLTREGPNYSRIEPDLYLGGYVQEPPRGTVAVLNLCETEDPYETRWHQWTPIADAEPAPDLAWLGEQVAFIDEHRRANRTVFVHCRNGVSRSAMVVLAHLMARHGWTRDEALEEVRVRRPIVRPNPAFMRLLLEWEKKLASDETKG
jgi:protein-tyrosine phosphatase